MNDSLSQRSKLEASNVPTAIIHSGMFVFANQAFLNQFNIVDFDELLGIPLLDLFVKDDRSQLAGYLQKAAADNTGSRIENKLLESMASTGASAKLLASFEKMVFEDEECVLISFSKASDSALVNKIKTISWSYYISILILVVLTFLPNALLIKLNINNAPKVLFPADEPAVVIDNQVREQFPTDQVMVFLFEGVALYSDGFLNAYHDLSENLKEHEKIQKIMSITTQEHISGSAEGFFVNPLIDVDALDDSHPRDRPAMIQADRFANRGLIAKDGSALSLVVIPKDADNSIQRLELYNDIKQMIKDVRLEGYVKAVAGQVPVDIAQLESMLRDNMIFIPATTIIGLVLIWLLFRRVLAVFVAGSVIGVIVSTTIALYVLFDQPFTLIASITPPLLSALTIATLVHFFNAMQHASLRGYIGRIRVKKALEEIFRPAVFTALTTSAGLASLGLSPIPAIATFGLIASVGVVLVFLVVMYMVPPLFIRWDHSPWPNSQSGLGWMNALVRGMGRIGLRYPLPVIGVALLLLGAGIPQILNIKTETNLQEFFKQDHEVRQSTSRIDEKLVGSMPLEVVFRSEEFDAFKDPELLARIKQFQDWAESLPEIDKSTSLVDFIEEMNWGFHEENDEFRSLPEDAELISQYLLVYDGEDLFDIVDQDFQVARVTLNLNVHSAREIQGVLDTINAYLDENFTDINADIAGSGRLFADMVDLLISGQVSSLGGALILIFVLMLFLWRSIGQSLICMLPNLSPIALIFIFMGLFDIWLDTATAMIASVAVGIAVDDTIHVFHGFIKRVKKGVAPAAAFARTTGHAGKAVMTTTIILASQFMILLFSAFIPTNNFGMLTSIGLIAALVFDMLVLPAILILLYRKKQSPAPEGEGIRNDG